MSKAGPVGRVVAMLEEAGYEPLEQPQSIAGIPFEFAAMLVGGSSLDLITISDLTIKGEEGRVRRRVEGLARALDLVGSRRSLTVILVGPRPPHSLIQVIAEVARVLAVGTPSEAEDTSLRDALAALLPLELVTEEEDEDEGGEPQWEQVRERLRDKHPAELAQVLAASSRGEGAVRETLRAVLAAPLEEKEEGKEEGGVIE